MIVFVLNTSLGRAKCPAFFIAIENKTDQCAKKSSLTVHRRSISRLPPFWLEPRRPSITADYARSIGEVVRIDNCHRRSIGVRRFYRSAVAPRALQAHRQCPHRSVQRPHPSRISERSLVSQSCRRTEKIGGLAHVRQRGASARRDRPKKTPVSLLKHDGLASPPP